MIRERPKSEAQFLAGGGEMGALIRAHPWEKTSLGPVSSWPQSLRTALGILLSSGYPMYIAWGPRFIQLYNDAYRPILGTTKHPQALGIGTPETFAEIWELIGPMFRNVLETGTASTFVDTMIALNRHGFAEECYFTFSYSAIPDDAVGVGGVYVTVLETTERMLRERRLGTLRDLLEIPSDNVLSICAASAAVLHRSAHDVPFALIYALDPAGNAVLAASAGLEPGHPLARVRIGADETHTWKFDLAPGTIERTSVAATTVVECPWPEPVNAVVQVPIAAPGQSRPQAMLIAGISPRLAYGPEYAEFFRSVAANIGSLFVEAEALAHQKRRAEELAELDRAKTVFFSDVSHEFRTPLALMMGPIEEALVGAEGEVRENLLVARRNTGRLLKLVNTLLDFARIEAGRAQTAFEPTNLALLTSDLAANFRAACERAGIVLVVDCPALESEAWIDREMWEKVVLNLLSNAFKFTLAGEIGVSLREEREVFVLAVRDTGVGIPDESMPDMFQRFHRVEGTRGRSHEGSGIGLALVQELVKLHGGRIEVRSTLGEGTEFTVTLPKGSNHLPADCIKPARAALPQSMRPEACLEEIMSWLPGEQAVEKVPALRGARILVADDNADMRNYLRRLLARDFTVETVSDGEQALAAIRAHRPDLVISDVMMPRLDGIGLVRAVRADPELRATPLMLLSARAGEEARIQGMGSGADDYLVKPFSARELLVRAGALIHAAEVRRQAHEALAHTAAQLEALLDAAPLGVYLVDDNFRLAAVNPVARPVFGPVEPLIGRDFEEVIHLLWDRAAASELVARFRHTLESGEPHVVSEWVNARIDRPATEYYEWQIHRLPLPGGRHGVVCYFRDITTVVLTREALREADQRKSEFIATLSHELRNPLAPLRNALHILSSSKPGTAPMPRIQEMMERQVNHLVRLVDDLLEVSRITRGEFALHRESVEVAAIVQNASEMVEPLVRESRHQLSLDIPQEPIVVDGDAARLIQLLGNVLSNAAKYTPAGGRIGVRARRDGEYATVTVIDNGAGIAPEDSERIFDMFARGRASGASGGLGIGLALARKLATMHGGTLTARSAGPGLGSEFVIRLPVAPAGTAPAQDVGAPGSALRGRRVLVVDDNCDAAESLAMVLQMQGGEVRVAHSGAEALATLEQFEASIVLLDIGMPEMDGYEVARRIRSQYSSRLPVLVALTGWGQEDDRARAREAGFDHHMVKPAELRSLQALLAAGNAKQQRETTNPK